MNLDDMIKCINRLLIDTTDVSVLSDCIEKYNTNDWMQYITNTKSEISSCYNKNLIYRNTIYEIFLISWNENASTPFHSHPKNGCILKILEGELNESYPDSSDKKRLYVGDVSYIGYNKYHKITSNTITYSLHIYSPPLFYS